MKSKIQQMRESHLRWRKFRNNRSLSDNCRKGRELRDRIALTYNIYDGRKKKIKARVLGDIRSEWFFDAVIDEMDQKFGKCLTNSIFVAYSESANQGFRSAHTARKYRDEFQAQKVKEEC